MILTRLKEETRPHHDAIERQIDLINRTLTVGDYALLLAKFHGIYTPLEQRLDRVAGLAGLNLDLEAAPQSAAIAIGSCRLGTGGTADRLASAVC